MGVVTGNKFNMLEQEAHKEADEQFKKVAAIGVDEEGTMEDQKSTPGIEKSNDKKNMSDERHTTVSKNVQ